MYKFKDTTENKANIVAKIIKIVCMQMSRRLTIEMTQLHVCACHSRQILTSKKKEK